MPAATMVAVPGHVPLIGRDDVLGQLTERLEAAFDGRPNLVLLRGEAGIGKSRVAAALADKARSAGALVTVGHCTPVSGSELAYGPFVEMLGDLETATKRLGEEPGTAWPVLTAPVAVNEPTGLTSLQDVGLARSRLFANVSQLLQRVGEHQPVLAVIEDLQWADASSIDLLTYLVRTVRDHRVLTVATFRDRDIVGPRTPVLLTELTRAENCVQLSLAAMSKVDIGELVRVAHPDVDAARVARVSDACDGNPFFALELARHPDVDSLAPAIQDVLLSELDGMPVDGLSLLRVAAVLGESVEHALLAASVDLGDDEFASAMRELRRRDVIVVHDNGYRFRHALVREVVVSDMLPPELMDAHRRAAQGLREIGADTRPALAARLAHHLVASADKTAALPVALVAARHARKVYAFAEAELHYAIVRELWPNVADAECHLGVTYTGLVCEEAETAAWCGRTEVATHVVREALAHADTDQAQAQLHLALGRALWAAGDGPGALAAYQRANECLVDGDDVRLRVRILTALAIGLLVNGYLSGARDTAGRAIELAGTTDATSDELHARITRASALALSGDVDTGAAELKDCVARATELDDFTALARSYGNLVHVYLVAGRLDEAIAVAEGGAGACRRYGPLVLIVPTMVENWLYALSRTGRWDEAEALAEEALDQSAAHGMGLVLHHALAEIAVARGDDETCDRELALAEALQLTDDPATVHDGAIIRAERALWRGKPEDAEHELTAALEVVKDRDQRELVVDLCRYALWALADQAVKQRPGRGGASEAPAARADALLALVDAAGTLDEQTSLAAMTATCRAEHARVRRTDTPEMWDSAAAQWRSMSHPYHEALALWRLAGAHLARHARNQGVQAITDALRIATTLGCGPLETQLQQLATFAGVDVVELPDLPKQEVRVDGAGNVTLTERERQVLTLVAKGYTNRRIARTLFITEKTASVHVSNILAKLGVSNRVEAAAAAHSLQLLELEEVP
jgi:DNA-binding CsgD family transcriptional regulator/tetratricopeptide (TPR) repeat protein